MSRRVMAWLAVLYSLAATTASPGQAQEILPQSEDAAPEIVAYSVMSESAGQDAAGVTLLRRAWIDRASQQVAAEFYPAQLLAANGARDHTARLAVSLDAEGEPVACRALGLTVMEVKNYQRSEMAIPDELTQQACDIATGQLAYHHALDSNAHAVPAEVAINVVFQWVRPMLAPAPSPPASWVPERNGWPPRYFYAARFAGMPVRLPNGRDFVASNRERPRRANVGVLFSTDIDGKVTECRVAAPSGVSDYDEASCPALSSRGQVPRLKNMPLQLEWDRQRLRYRLPQDTRGPRLLEEMAVAGDSSPDGQRFVAVELAVSPEGRLLGCQVVRPSFDDALDAASCAQFPPDLRFTRPTGLFGEPTEGRLTMEIDWRTGQLRPWGYLQP